MITDEQGGEWLLQKFYDDGWKYYVKNVDGIAFLTIKRPVMNDDILDINGAGDVKCINNISKIMPQIEQNEVLNIAEELGLIDWSKVPVDTPVLVKDYENNSWKKRYFAYFQYDKVYTWGNGATSWSSERSGSVTPWMYAKLAEV